MELKGDLDKALTASTSDDNLISLINQKLLKAYKEEEDFWRQRSRLLWLSLGDKNTIFFSCCNQREESQKQNLGHRKCRRGTCF